MLAKAAMPCSKPSPTRSAAHPARPDMTAPEFGEYLGGADARRTLLTPEAAA